jgi:hypothetical protein
MQAASCAKRHLSRHPTSCGEIPDRPPSRFHKGEPAPGFEPGAITRTLSLGEDEQLALPYEGPGGEPLRKGRRPRVRKGTEAAPAPAAGELSSSEAAEALAFRELGPLQRAFTGRDQISAIIPALVTREIPAFVIQGKVIETHLLPNFARLQIARGRAE